MWVGSIGGTCNGSAETLDRPKAADTLSTKPTRGYGMAKQLSVRPVSIKQANDFIRDYHRHHRPTVRNNGKWALAGVNERGEIIGVAVTAAPVSAAYMDGYTIEISRLCVKEGAPKGSCSFLLSKCCAIWRLMGGRRVLTYTLQSESGASLRGAGWCLVGDVRPHRRWEGKTRLDGIERASLPIYRVPKSRWEKIL